MPVARIGDLQDLPQGGACVDVAANDLVEAAFSGEAFHGWKPVLGKRLVSSSPGSPEKFGIQVPEKYALVNAVDGAPLSGGALDGAPYSGARLLEPGEHQYTPPDGTPEVAVMLADAVALGYRPAPLPPPEDPSNDKDDKRPTKFQRGFSKLVQ